MANLGTRRIGQQYSTGGWIREGEERYVEVTTPYHVAQKRALDILSYYRIDPHSVLIDGLWRAWQK